MAQTTILAISFLLQLTAALLALRLIPLTGRRLAWSLISFVILLMAVRRGLSLYEALAYPAPPQPGGLAAELVALVASALMCAGIALIGPIFRQYQNQSDRLQASKEQLTRSEQEKKLILSSITDTVAFIHAPDCRVVWNNRSLDVPGEKATCRRLLGFEEMDCGHCPVRATFSTEASCRKEIRTSGGQRISLRTFPVLGGGRGIAGVVAVSRDITALRKAEEEVQAERELLQMISDNSPSCIFVKDREGRYRLANKTLADFYDLAPPDILGKKDEELNQPSIAEVFRGQDHRVMESGRSLTIEECLDIKRPERVYLTTKFPLWDRSGTVAGVCGISTDISAWKQVEELEKRLREQALKAGRLFDYQDRLRAMGEAMLQVEERERRSMADWLHDGIGQLLALIQIKLDSMAMKSGVESEDARVVEELVGTAISETRKLTFELCPPLLRELGLRKAVERLCEDARKEYGLDVSHDCDGFDRPTHVDLDGFLYRTIRELLRNVNKHARASSAHVSIKAGSDAIAVQVEDDGCGFEQADVFDSVKGQATFGLCNLRERLVSWGGRLDIASGPGRGAKVRIELPVPSTYDPGEET